MTHDIFTLSGIQAGLNAAAEEMFAVLKKTAMSPIIFEVLDVGTGITDGSGNLVSSGTGIPTFVGVLDKAVKRIIELHAGHIAAGDVFISNDPGDGGVTHLNDMAVRIWSRSGAPVDSNSRWHSQAVSCWQRITKWRSTLLLVAGCAT